MFLRDEQAAFIEHCEQILGRRVRVIHTYQHALNGVALELSAEEAIAVADHASVQSVTREGVYYTQSDVGPAWIGAPTVWSLPDIGTMGEGAVVAILDSGINSDHPAFAAVGDDGYVHSNPLGNGRFIPGSYCDIEDGSFCNDKLIGAWTFVRGPGDPQSPEDSDGHGTHTASTAAGNVLNASLITPTAEFARALSGVAPHANIIAYDVCIDSCPGSALLAAVNQVVIDASVLPNGIAALNYSISGGADPYSDNIELAFLDAAAAGVYVSTSGGNSGPEASTTGHNSPWVANTAAMTHNRVVENSLIALTSSVGSLGNLKGAGLTSGYGPARIVHARDFPTTDGTANQINPGQCLDPFPEGTFSGEIVVCDRGTISRVEKGANVLAGGAGGFVLANTAAQGESVAGDAHVLPGVHIGFSAGESLRAWLSENADAEAVIAGFSVSEDPSQGDVMASFSSRGPNAALDVIKPDIGAPGVDVLAAVANGDGPGPEYDFLSGTSMASPHHAGAAALLTVLRPGWTAFERKSAMMLTAKADGHRKEDGTTPTDPFDVGAGRVELRNIASNHLVMSETPENFLAADPALGGDPKTLNLASMQDSLCVGGCSWKRTVTNKGQETSRWRLQVEASEGVRANVSPRRLKLRPGESRTVSVKFDTALADDGWNFGRLTLESKARGTRGMPIAARAAKSTDPDLLSTTVDATEVFEGDRLTYEIKITNGQLIDPIRLVDVLPRELEIIRNTLTATVNSGTTLKPARVSDRTLTWEGVLDTGKLEINSGESPAGFISLASFGVAPVGCPDNCDDGGISLTVPSFVYNGKTYNSVLWSVNGTLEPGAESGSASSAFNTRLPSAFGPNNLIAPFWTDLDMGQDGDGAEWYYAVLRAGDVSYTVYEWNNVPRFADDDTRSTFQVWIQNGDSGNIWFVYDKLDNLDVASFVTVGAEDSTGTVGSSLYFAGEGQRPEKGIDLQVEQTLAGQATFTFQAEVDDCGEEDDGPEALVGRASLTSGDIAHRAVAAVRCLPEQDSDD